MIELFGATIAILLTWVVLFLIFAGLGLLVRRAFGLSIHCAENYLLCFWTGWAIVIAILQVWHLFLPIGWPAFAVISLVGIAGLLWNAHDIWRWIRTKSTRKLILGSFLFIVAVWLAQRAMMPPLAYDSGLYHLNAVRWAASYPIVPGLGNLHGRLAFNSAYFLYVAMLEIGPWIGRSHHLANGLLFWVLFAQILLSGLNLLDVRDGWQTKDIFHVLLLPPIIFQSLDINVSSPTPDTAIFILGIVLTSQLLNLFSQKDSSSKKIKYDLLVIILIVCIGITVKLNFAVLGGVSALLAFLFWFARYRDDQIQARKTLAWTALCMVAIILPWMIRGVILSGYIAYPSTIGAFPVAWRIPREAAIDEANWIRSWARAPGIHWNQVLGNWNWFKPWAYNILKNYFNVTIPLLLTIGSSLLIFPLRLVKIRKSQTIQWAILTPSLANLAFWFMTAPDPRFAGASFWILGAGAVALAIDRIKQLKRTTLSSATLCLSLILCMIPFRHMTLYYGPGEDHGFHATPRSELTTFVTRSEVLLYTPQEGDQCWDAPLPCTPYPNADLRLRRQGNLGSGFLLETNE
jgi:hypothetical protein